MRSKGFIHQVQQKAADNRRRIWAPGQRTNTNWPLCLTCCREVDAASLENVNSFSCEIKVTCHGKEDFYKVSFPFRIEGDPLDDDNANASIRRAMGDFCAFPKNHEE